MDISLFFLIFGTITACYFYLTKNYSYWRDRGIPCPKSIFPIFGHMWPVVSLKMSMGEFSRQIYENNPDRSMVGFYNRTTPALVIREPKLMKTVLQTNFASFSENLFKIDPHLDILAAINPFFASGDVWLTSRKRLTRAFSTRRLKILFDHIERVCKKFENYLNQKLKNNNGRMEVELRDLFFKYVGEVIANASLGIEGFCFNDESHPTSFVAMGNLLFEPSFLVLAAQLLNFFLPDLNKILRMPFVPQQLDRFYHNIVKETLQNRGEGIEPRNDFLQVMIDMEKTEGKQFDEAMLTAYAFIFFASGYETTTVTLSFVAYQLARYPCIQQKLRNEVETVLAKHDGQITYESLKEMSYMDQVINESQRLYPTVSAMGKICTEKLELKGSDGLCCCVQPGMEIIMPISGLHRDPKYWSDPDIFDPDRFTMDRKMEIEKYHFLPFSEGPRLCPGMRIALLQIKACLAMFVRRYALETSPKTQDSIKMMPGFLSVPSDGILVNIRYI